jgi:succinate dehydrogenase / fumarate reductase, cytochrome b subunit
MTWKQVFTSSVGKKLIMGVTGISLILFLVVHVGLNACIWANDGGRMFNVAAHFMGSTVVMRILEIGLFVGLLAHIVQGLLLEGNNLSRRGKGYDKSYGNKGSKWYSRAMGLLGTLILLFLILHLIDFWIPSRFQEMPEIAVDKSGREIHNLYILMIERFQYLWVVIVYVLGCISLAYHLMHGFQSAFRTLGLYNKRYIAMVSAVGFWFSVIVCLGFAMMPISIYLQWIH